MSRAKMPPQIFRLVLLTIAIVVTYLIARQLLTPASFRQYGFYRGEALAERASLTPVFAGRKACLECHEEIQAQLFKGEHKTMAVNLATVPPRLTPWIPTAKPRSPTSGTPWPARVVMK